MAIQSEVRQFAELIHAKQKKLEGYNGNLFIKNDTTLIIKKRGYFYPGNIIFNKIQKNIWRKANDGDYKINPPLRDALYFKSHKEFEKYLKYVVMYKITYH